MSLSYSLLGLLSYSPMAGYDLKKIFDDSINFFWSAQTSQIYRELNLLERKECVVSEVKPGDKGPDKRIYSITEKGRNSLKEWLTNTPENIAEDDRNAFVMRVFFSSCVGIDELVYQLNNRLRKYKKDLKELKAVEAKIDDYAQMLNKAGEIPYWRIAISRGFHDLESHIKWANESLDYLQGLQNQDKKRKRHSTNKNTKRRGNK